jgi:hypothetical protein
MRLAATLHRVHLGPSTTSLPPCSGCGPETNADTSALESGARRAEICPRRTLRNISASAQVSARPFRTGDPTVARLQTTEDSRRVRLQWRQVVGGERVGRIDDEHQVE